MSTQGKGTHLVHSGWDSGKLVFYEKAYGHTTTGDIFEIGTSQITVGDTAQDVDFMIYLGNSGSSYVKFDAGASSMTVAGVTVSVTGAFDIGSGDLQIDTGYGLLVGSDTQLTISDGDGSTNLVPEGQFLGVGTAFSGGALALATFNATNTLAVAPKLAFVKGAAATQVATTAVADNEVIGAIIGYGSDSADFETPVAAIEIVVDDAGGPGASAIGGSIEFWTTADAGTTLTKALTLSCAQVATFVGAIVVDDTTESTSTTTGSIQTDGGLACAKDFYAGDDIFLTDGAVLNFNAGNVTITHGAATLAIAGAAVTINDAGADLDFRVESDNLAYALYVDAGKDCVVIGDNTDISDVDYRLMVGNVAKTLAQDQSAAILYVAPTASTTEAGAGTHGYIASAYFKEPNITGGVAGTTVAATVYIADAPTEASANAALYIASGSLVTAGTVSITVADAGLTTTCATLNATTGRIAKFQGTIDAGNLGDGYGAVEVDVTMTGNVAGICAPFSSWANITGTGAVGAQIVAAQSNGIYADSGANTGSIVIFGMRAQGILTDAPTVFAPFSLNTSNRAITGLFHMNANPDVGYQAAAGETSGKVGDVPLFCDNAGQQYFVRIYNARG